MSTEDTIGLGGGKQTLPVEWHDCRWQPAVQQRCGVGRRAVVGLKPLLPLPRLVALAPPARSQSLYKLMKKKSSGLRRFEWGFTLVELLTVIAIIAILAAMLLPVLSRVKLSAYKTQARVQVNDIATAITAYDSAYGRFPVSAATQTAAAASGGGDITCGGTYTNASGVIWPVLTATPTAYIPSNSDVIAILMDYTNFPNPYFGGATVNANYQKNPQKTIFLNAKLSGWDTQKPGAPLPGVGSDLVYRDPWGNPYIISMDLNYDGQCQDAFYASQSVSQNPPGTYVQTGFNGLSNPNPPTPTQPLQVNDFLFHGSVMVWSMGPYGPGTPSASSFDPTKAANSAANKNHILSWQQ